MSMRPTLNELLLDKFNSPLLLYLIPSGIAIYVVAVGLTGWLLVKRSKSSGLSGARAAGAALWAVAAGLAGARIYYLLHHYDYVAQHVDVIYQCGRGLASWGAYIVGLSAFVLYLRVRREDTIEYLDVLASVLGLGPFVIRWACFLNGCCYGTPTDLPWGVSYPANSFAFRSQLQAGLVTVGDPRSLPVHPVQIYLSVLGLSLFVLATLFWKRFSNLRGATFLFYWFIYGASRFFLEFLRGDVPRYTVAELTLSQIVIVFVLAGIVAGFLRLYRFGDKAASRTSV
jgi:phosphatidylglycerol:prolipoprotein diacylglycerol transferase